MDNIVKANKKIPERKCTGCNESRPKKELIRIVRSPEGEISLDFTGKKNGRGAYLCKNTECLKKAVKTKKIARSLNCEISPEILDMLEKTIAEAENDRTE